MTVGELLERVMPAIETKTPQMPFMQAVQSVVELVVLRLWKTGSDLLKEDWSDSVSSGDPEVILPPGFLGFVKSTFPWLDGSTTTLLPLPPGIKHTLTQARKPEFYELRARKITLYPTPIASYTIKGEIHQRPAAILALDDDLSFDGLFDQAITQGVIRIIQEGSKFAVTPEFKIFMSELVDEVAPLRPSKLVTWHCVT